MSRSRVGVWLVAITCLVAVSRGDPSDKRPETFDLEITLVTPHNPDFTILTTISIEQSFEVTATNGLVRNTFSGTLRPPVGDKFTLDLTVSEWESERSNIKDTMSLDLELGKPWSGGPIESFVFLRIVMLRRHDSRLKLLGRSVAEESAASTDQRPEAEQ